MNKRTKDPSRDMIEPIASLLRKSEKAGLKLTAGTWQHTMLQGNLRALRIALDLMGGDENGAAAASREDLQAALRAFADMTARSRQAQAKFAPRTAHHSLQKNRIRAFRAAANAIRARLK